MAGLITRLKSSQPAVAEVEREITVIQQEIASLESQISQVEDQQADSWGDTKASEKLEAQFTALSNRLRVARNVLNKLNTELSEAQARLMMADYRAALAERDERQRLFNEAREHWDKLKADVIEAERDARRKGDIFDTADRRVKHLEKQLKEAGIQVE